MSKSSYDEALDILLNSFQDPQDEDNDCYMLDFEQLNNITKTISQAQKQEKLLELYNRLFNVCKEYKRASIGLSDDSEFLNVMSELEEEDDEMDGLIHE